MRKVGRSQHITWNPSSGARKSCYLFDELPADPKVFACHGANNPFEDQFLNELVSTRAFQRLKNIGFLGAIDYLKHGNGDQAHRHRHNRYEHSLGVADLALRYSAIRKLDTKTRRTVAAAALLHDIGHGPLSHTLEPVFKEFFEVDHHRSGNAVLMGESPFGNSISEILKSYAVDLDEVRAFINGDHSGSHAHLFSSPINIDTIEGITRCYFSVLGSTTSPAVRLVEAIAKGGSFPVAAADAFWRLKHSVYNLFIHGRSGLIQDAIAQNYMRKRLHQFGPKDFYDDERSLRRKKRTLFHWILAAKTPEKISCKISSTILDEPVTAPVRAFLVDPSVKIESNESLKRRYQQYKDVKVVALGDLLPTQTVDENTQSHCLFESGDLTENGPNYKRRTQSVRERVARTAG